MVTTHGFRLKGNRVTIETVANEGLGPRARELMAATTETDALQLKGCD